MYELTVHEVFSAAHRLPNTGGRCERLHGHNWKVEIQVAAEELNDVGMVLDFHELRKALHAVLDELDHSFLNELPAFQQSLPTAENLARYIHGGLAGRLPAPRVRLARVRVWESEDSAASYSEPPTTPSPDAPRRG
jgi:6-pyruvoyltetrahydropterin/6-carboxytetrahydropterin synthase